jgi:outer membrane lipoprotein-sorting protein
MKRHERFSILALLAFAPAIAQIPDDPGREIAVEASRRASGFQDLSATLRMTVRGANDAERVRELTIKTLEVDQAGERTLVRFEAPRDLRGTTLLTVNHGDGSSDQWLYLPALRRVKRIAGSSQSGSFMGSEFAYEDIGTMEPDRYSYRLIETDTQDGVPAWVVERRPKNASSLYLRQLVWFDRQEYRVLRIDFYDRSDVLLKTLILRRFRQHGGRFWRPDEMEMTNHQTGASTTLEWSDFVLGAGLETREFESNRLRRGA